MQNENQTLTIFLFASLMMFVVAWGIILFVVFVRKKLIEKGKRIEALEQEKTLLVFTSASEAEERERARIARNLHDEISVKLTVHKNTLEKFATDFSNREFDQPAFETEIAKIEKLREAINSCALELVPTYLLNSGLAAAVDDEIIQINNAGKVRAKCKIQSDTFAKKFNKHQLVNAYRICLEILNNLLKHALPTNITVTFSELETQHLITIEHDGRRISNEDAELFLETSQGLGMKSLKARTMMLNATLSYQVANDKPAVLIAIPFESKTDDQALI
jgi:two-component system NarL family sensor kinase